MYLIFKKKCMKKDLNYIIVLFLLAIICYSCTNKQHVRNSNDESEVVDSISQSNLYIPENIYDFGQIEKTKDTLVHTFDFINTGNSPLVIYDVEVSCNCTSVKFDRQPIKPMENGKIMVYLDPQKQYGKISKKLFIRSNAQNALEILYIRANINY